MISCSASSRWQQSTWDGPSVILHADASATLGVRLPWSRGGAVAPSSRLQTNVPPDGTTTAEVRTPSSIGTARCVANCPLQDQERELGMTKSESQKAESPAQLIDARIKELGDWRGEMLSRLRSLIKETDPDVVEEWKWRGVPVWYDDGMICTGETYKSVVKMTFAKGAALKDPSGLFNSSLEGNTRRAIDFHEGEKINEKALKALIRAAVTLNQSGSKK